MNIIRNTALSWRQTATNISNVKSTTYGTRFSTLLFIDRENRLRFMERNHDSLRSSSATAEFKLMLQPS
jgi:uncharacterized protein with NRDE domain